jgi:hypothetical protein
VSGCLKAGLDKLGQFPPRKDKARRQCHAHPTRESRAMSVVSRNISRHGRSRTGAMCRTCPKDHSHGVAARLSVYDEIEERLICQRAINAASRSRQTISGDAPATTFPTPLQRLVIATSPERRGRTWQKSVAPNAPRDLYSQNPFWKDI